MDITLRPIGVVRSRYLTPLDAPRQGTFATAEATLEIAPEFADGLEGVESHERLLIVWWAHVAERNVLSRPGSAGVFTMRTPHRPNPVCLTEVTLLRREGNRLTVTGLEATDGTPILDIKCVAVEHDGWTPLPSVEGDGLRFD